MVHTELVSLSCVNGAEIMLQWCLSDQGTMHEMTIFCFKNYTVMLKNVGYAITMNLHQ